MMRSLFSGVSGLRAHQVKMDVIGNNVANVNTVGYKAGRMTFKEGFAQMMQGATRPVGQQGGINPMQIGLGTQVGSVDTLFSQGAMEMTGMQTDLAIQGESFFVVANGAQLSYTRAGNFQLDADGRLVSPTNGAVVQGRMAVNGTFVGGVQDIVLPFGQRSPAAATTETSLGGNLDAAAATGTAESSSITVFDSLGNQHELKVTMTKTATAGEWSWAVDTAALQASGIDPATLTGGTGTLTFDANGVLTATTGGPIGFAVAGANPLSITLDTAGLSQFAGSSTAVFRDQNGYTMGTLESFSIDNTGTIIGAFTNGVTEPIAQVALADFNNPGGLVRTGDNQYSVSPNSGGAVIGYAGESSNSSVTAGALEMSNVDLAQEFTSMIITQRGFQANGRMISNADEMLQEVVNLKR